MPIIRPFRGKHPKIASDVFIAENAVVIGDVEIGSQSNVWYNAVIRGDYHYIRIGSRTNIQDGAILHVTNDHFPLNIGSNVGIAHGAIVHGCTIEDNVLIGIGSKVLDGVKIASYSAVAAGSLVREGMEIPSGVLVAGVPAEIKREISEKERNLIDIMCKLYVEYAQTYMTELNDESNLQ